MPLQCAEIPALAVAGKRPAQRLAGADGIGIPVVADHGAFWQVGKIGGGDLGRMSAGSQPLAVQSLVQHRRARFGDVEGFPETGDEVLRPCAPAMEAGPVAGRQRRNLVEEEQFGPARTSLPVDHSIAAHRHPANAAEIAHADDPSLERPALLQQRPGVRIMDDAAIAHQAAAFGHGMDGAERIDPILQWHGSFSWAEPETASRFSGMYARSKGPGDGSVGVPRNVRPACLGSGAADMISLSPSFSCQ